MFYSLYEDCDVLLEAEVVAGAVYLHCKVKSKFTVALYKKFLVVFTAVLSQLKSRYAAVRALIPCSDRKLARFAQLFQLKQKGFIPRSNGRKAYYIYEVDRYG
jgi:hypothetical protein